MPTSFDPPSPHPSKPFEGVVTPDASPRRVWWRVWLRVLTLRFDQEDIASLGWMHLVLGGLMVWAVGMGRYWDAPRAELLQMLGVGSLIYVPVLAGVLWFVTQGLKPERTGYLKLLIFVTLTAPPAAVYAIPIERWVSMPTAQSLNAWALGVVAIWRVVMYARYLHVWNRLPSNALVVALLLPLTGIVFALATLNLEHVVFDIMGGLGQADPSSADSRYMIVLVLSFFSLLLAPLFLIAWVILAVSRFDGKL